MTQKQKEVFVTIVIPTKNGGPLFGQVLEGVLNQQVPWIFEVLVVDSGSTDETLSMVAKYPEVRLLRIDPREFGHGKTRNLAVAAAAGDYIAMITQDALPCTPFWLVELLKPALADERIAGVFGRHIAYPSASVFTRRELEQHFAGFLLRPVSELDDQNRYLTDEGYRQFLYFFSDNNALLRRSVWERIPYPDVDFAEDQAWARAVIEAGYRKAYAHEAAVYHSHNYPVLERLQRSFDESYALNVLFGYSGGQGLKNAIKSWVGLTFRDLNIARRERMLFKVPMLLIKVPIDNGMRLLGAYLGNPRIKLPAFIRKQLSRDYKLRMLNNR